MKFYENKNFGVIAIVAIAVAVAFNVSLSKQTHHQASQLVLANVEALAGDEWEDVWNFIALFESLKDNDSTLNDEPAMCCLTINSRREVRTNYVELKFTGSISTSPHTSTVYYGELSGSYFGAGFIVGAEGSVKRTVESAVAKTYDITQVTCDLSYVDVTCCYLGGFMACTPVNC